MKIVDLLAPGGVLELAGTTPGAVLAELAAPVARAFGLDAAQLSSALAAREKLSSTGVGEGVAIPHARLRGLPQMACCLGRSQAGVDFHAIDGRPVRLFLALFAPEGSAGAHLQALSKVSRVFKGAGFREGALQAADTEALKKLLEAEDAKS